LSIGLCTFCLYLLTHDHPDLDHFLLPPASTPPFLSSAFLLRIKTQIRSPLFVNSFHSSMSSAAIPYPHYLIFSFFAVTRLQDNLG
jgi:hypothetical protein